MITHNSTLWAVYAVGEMDGDTVGETEGLAVDGCERIENKGKSENKDTADTRYARTENKRCFKFSKLSHRNFTHLVSFPFSPAKMMA